MVTLMARVGSIPALNTEGERISTLSVPPDVVKPRRIISPRDGSRYADR